MFDVIAEWSGRYPCLCLEGAWRLVIDGRDYSYLLDGRSCMDTVRDYDQWEFVGDYDVEWHTERCGMERDEWRRANAGWLSRIPCDPSMRDELEDTVFDAIQASDFMPGCCGGCI